MFEEFRVWCGKNGFQSVCTGSLNLFIAKVCSTLESATKAKNIRAACSLLCDLLEQPKQHNPLTWRMVEALGKSYNKNRLIKAALDHDRVLAVFDLDLSPELALLWLFLTLGIRITEANGLDASCTKGDILWTPHSKGFPTRSVPMSPLAQKAVSVLSSHFGRSV